MREQVEAGQQAVFGPGSRSSGSRCLRLVRPWAPDEAAVGRGEGTRGGASAGTASDRSYLAPASVVELELARPSAMVVMRQVLDAWRSAERQLDTAFEGSVERRHIQIQVATLRELYHELYACVRHAQVEQAAIAGW
jgi:hypothetical protein